MRRFILIPLPTSLAVTALALAALAAAPERASAQSLTPGAAADSALLHHPSVLAAEARVEGAGAARDAARAAFLPTVAGGTGITRHEEPMVVAPLHGFDPMDPPAFDRTLVQSQLALDFTVFDGGARRARLRGAGATEAGLEARRDADRQDLLETVVQAYTGVLATRALLLAADAQGEALAVELDRARQRLAEGTAARVEVLRAEAALQDARAQQASAEARAALAERALARVMGVEPGTVEERPLADVAPADAAPGDGPATREDPRVAAARRAVEAARARVGAERAARLPSLRASAGLLNFGSGEGEYVTEWQAGLRLSWPLFTGGARQAAIRRSEAELRVAEEELRLAELAVASELDAARASLAEASARVRALSASVDQWEEVARIEALALETGAGVQQDYLRAEAALFQARAGQARARYDEILALVGRARAQGLLDRGWMDDALEIR